MAFSISEIAAALGAEADGDLDLQVSGAAEPQAATSDQLALAMSPAYAPGLATGAAKAAVVWPGADRRALGLQAVVYAPRARLALARLTGMLWPDDAFGAGVHASAVIDPSAQIGAGAVIGPFTAIGPGVVIGTGARIGPNVYIGAGVRLGADARVHAGARLMPRVVAGDRLVMQPGATVGGDGFSFVTEVPSNPERAKESGGMERLAPPDGEVPWHKIQSLGAVVLGDDVEIGANSTVDAGTIRPTRIGTGTKIDNLVHVGHNCEIGRDCLLCGQVGIAGSATIGDRVVLGGQTGVADHHRIGDDVVTGGATVILSNVPAGSVLLGYPAQRMDRAIAQYKAQRRAGRDAAAPQKPVPKDPANH